MVGRGGFCAEMRSSVVIKVGSGLIRTAVCIHSRRHDSEGLSDTSSVVKVVVAPALVRVEHVVRAQVRVHRVAPHHLWTQVVESGYKGARAIAPRMPTIICAHRVVSRLPHALVDAHQQLLVRTFCGVETKPEGRRYDHGHYHHQHNQRHHQTPLHT